MGKQRHKSNTAGGFNGMSSLSRARPCLAQLVKSEKIDMRIADQKHQDTREGGSPGKDLEVWRVTELR